MLAVSARAEIEWKPVRGGKLKWEGSAFTPRLYEFPNAIQRVDAELESNLSLTDGEGIQYQAKFLPWVWMNSPQPDSDLRKKVGFFGEIKEGWIERSAPGWELRLGNQIISWGAADKINPTDVVNSSDLTDPFHQRKLPQTAARLKLHPESLPDYQLEILASPFFKDPRLPIRLPKSGVVDVNPFTSRWLVPLPRSVQGNGVTVPFLYQVSSPTYPSTWMGAARLEISRMAGWDYSLSYYNGVENLPRFAVSLSGNPSVATTPITATLFPSYHRMQMWGIDGQGNVSLGDQQFGLRFENALVFRDNSRANSATSSVRDDLTKQDYMWSVAGVDTNLPFKVLTTSMYINGQFVFYHRLGQEASPGALRIDGLPSGLPMDRNTVVFVQNKTVLGVNLNQAWVHSLRHNDGVYSPGMSAQITDQMNANITMDYFYGTRPGFFAQFVDARRGYLSVEYEF